MYTNMMVDDSATRVFQAGESLTGGAFTAVNLSGDGVATATNASIAPIGILIAETNETCAAGEDVAVAVRGCCPWLVNESVVAGDYLTVGEGGKANKATAGTIMFARALKNAAANEAAQVLIINGGKA